MIKQRKSSYSRIVTTGLIIVLLVLAACSDETNTVIPTNQSSLAPLSLIFSTPSQAGQKKSINAMVFSPDGKLVASAGGDYAIRFWSTSSDKEILTLKGHTDSVTNLAFSPDGKFLASGGKDGTVRVWSVTTGQQVTSLDLGNKYYLISALAFSPDGKTLAVLGNNEQPDFYTLWSVGDWKQLASFAVDSAGYAGSIAFDAENGAMAAGVTQEEETVLSFFNLLNGQKLTSLDIGIRVYPLTSGYFPLVFSPTGKVIAAVDGDKKNNIVLWNRTDGKKLATIQVQAEEVANLAFSFDSQMLAFVTATGEVKIWSLNTQKELYSFKTLSRHTSLAFSPDGKQLVSGDEQGTIKFWSLENGKELKTIQGNRQAINAVAFNPNNTDFASGNDEGLIKIFAVPSGKELITIKAFSGACKALAFSPDGKTLASGGEENSIKFWSVENGKPTGELKVNTKTIESLQYSSGGNYLASIGKNDYSSSLQAWEVKTGKLLKEVEGTNDREVVAAAFSPDNTQLAYLANSPYDALAGLWFWTVGRSEEETRVDGAEAHLTAFSFSADGKLLVSAFDTYWGLNPQWQRGFEILSVVGQKRISRIETFNRRLSWLVFSPDTQTIYSAGEDRIIRGWDMQSGKELFSTTSEQTYGLQATVLSKNGKYIASGQLDGSVKLWERK
jgi:WD40 repeat protein